jgi:soluble lytic murein transglycosylase
MAQQLATNRTPAAYAGVTHYAQTHNGEAAAAAYLALGHAYLLDHRYPDAIASLAKAKARDGGLDDYTDYLTSQAELQSGQLPQAQAVLTAFAAKHPDSIFVPHLPVEIANLALSQNDSGTALRVLSERAGTELAGRPDYELALARAQQMAGDNARAADTFRRLYLTHPLSAEAQQARAQLQALGAEAHLTVAERERHADALFRAGRYNDAAEDYRSLAADPELSQPGPDKLGLRNELLVAAAACDYKLKRATREQVEALPDTADEAGARRLYLLMELARDRDDGDAQRALVEQMEQRFPASPWLAEALHSSGNMYLLKKDYASAAQYYADLARHFPRACSGGGPEPCSNLAPSSHWRAAWLDYRLGQFATASQMMDEQIAHYPGESETPAALYWRARIFEDQEHAPGKAAAYFQTIEDTYRNSYYALLAHDRLAALGSVAPAPAPELASIHPEQVPALTDDVPEDDPHVIKARLLANAGLNEYIAPEIQAAEGSREWGAFAEAEIYTAAGDNFRAMRVMKRALPFYPESPVDAIPLAYWRILFPQAYWSSIQSYAGRNGLDPYMVASLIRQESEFNPAVISYANAYGLMQLLPRVGAQLARQEGIRHFDSNELLNPVTNIRLGTRYLRQELEKFDGQQEYAFAAYNAGEDRVDDWRSASDLHGMDEFVESIPFTQTRDYVQAIIRNERIYRELNRRLAARGASLTQSASAGREPTAKLEKVVAEPARE